MEIPWGNGEIQTVDNKLNGNGGKNVLRKLIERAFCNGVAVGICLYQRMIISAHARKKPLQIGEELYYIQNGRERLQEVLEKICR